MGNPDVTEGAPFDWTRLEELGATPSGRAGLRKLIQVFLSTTRDTLPLLRSQASADDPAALARTLHRLKGGCEMIGARRMAALASAMEAHALEGRPDASGMLLEAMEAEFRRVAPLLEARAGA